MENPKTPETQDTQNRGDKTLEDNSGSFALLDSTVGSIELALVSKISVKENDKRTDLCDNYTGFDKVVNQELEAEKEDKCSVDAENLVATVNAAAEIDNKGLNGDGNEGSLLINGEFDKENKANLCSIQSQSDEKLQDLDGSQSPRDRIEKIVEDEGTKEDDNGAESNVLDFSKKIEVTGDEISVFVDFSGLNNDEANGDKRQVIEHDDSQEYNFFVGDVVWVKTKSQTWWPGKIHDPSDASKLVDTDRKDSLLVGYFGNSHVIWCFPSQLKPFLEIFDRISVQNKSRSFLGAVEKAVDEFGRLVKLQLTCPCIHKEIVSLPEKRFGDLGELSVSHFEPAVFLAQLKNFALVVSMPCTLELTVAKNRLSAFCRSLGHAQLPPHQLHEKSDNEHSSGGRSNAKSKYNVQEGSKSPRFAKSSEESDELQQQTNEDEDSDEKEVSGEVKIESNDSSMRNSDGGAEGKIEKGSESRERRKSKYLSYPYINWGQKAITADTEDCKGLKAPHDGVDLNMGNGFESPSIAKYSGQKFWRKWYRIFTSGDNLKLSGKPEITNASPAEYLSDLRFAAVDCLYPNEIKNFDLVSWFFSKFRISGYHDEAIYTGRNQDRAAESCLLGNNQPEIKPHSPTVKTQVKKRKRQATSKHSKKDVNGKPKAFERYKSPETSQSDLNGKPKKERASSGRKKTKTLSGLSDVNINFSTSSIFVKDSVHMDPIVSIGKPRQKKRKREEASGVPDLNGNNGISTLSVEEQTAVRQVVSQGKSEQAARQVGSQGKSEPKKRKKKKATLEDPKFTPVSLDMNGNQKPGSFFIDLQVMAPHSLGVNPGKSDSEVREGRASSLEFAGSKEQEESGKRKRKRKGKATTEDPNTILPSSIPDLNGNTNNIESNLLGKEVSITNDISPQVKQKQKRRRKGEANLQNQRNKSKEDLGTALLLTFSLGNPMPSKEELITTFSKSGPLKESDIYFSEESSTARLVFSKSTSAVEAVQTIEKNKPFGAALVKHQLHNLSSATFTNPKKNLGSQKPNSSGEAPPLEFMKQNLQMMTSMLEKSGDNLSSEMRAKLEVEIKGLLTKVSSMAGSSLSS